MQTTCWTVTLQAGVAFRTLPSGILICTWCNSVLLTQRIQQEQTIQKYIIFQVQTSDLMSLQKPFSFFFKKKFGGHQSFLWGHWYPCFGLLVTSWLGFKARVGPLACMLCCLCFMDSSDSPLVNTCWLLGNQHDGWAIFNPSPPIFVHVTVWPKTNRVIGNTED